MDAIVSTSENNRKFYANPFSTSKENLLPPADFLRAVCKVTVTELKLVGFTKDELGLCIDALWLDDSETILTNKPFGLDFVRDIEEVIAVEHIDETWEIDKEAFLNKLHSLSSLQVAFLSIWAQRPSLVGLPEHTSLVEYIMDLAA
jgi:hypothetical protein